MQTAQFDPMQSDPRAFRDALGRFGTGVTVVTCASPLGPLGITANSFASVSLDPPLVLWSPARKSARHDAFVNAKRFAIHVLGADQKGMCEGFARSGEAFDALDWEPSRFGVPLISGCLARFECQMHAVHDGGDHSIIVAQVHNVSTRAGDPLMFFGGRYSAIHPESP